MPSVVGWRTWAYRSLTVSGKGRRKLLDTWRGFDKIDLQPLYKTTISTLEMKWRGIHKGLLILQEEWWGEIDGQQPGLFLKNQNILISVWKSTVIYHSVIVCNIKLWRCDVNHETLANICAFNNFCKCFDFFHTLHI